MMSLAGYFISISSLRSPTLLPHLLSITFSASAPSLSSPLLSFPQSPSSTPTSSPPSPCHPFISHPAILSLSPCRPPPPLLHFSSLLSSAPYCYINLSGRRSISVPRLLFFPSFSAPLLTLEPVCSRILFSRKCGSPLALSPCCNHFHHCVTACSLSAVFNRVNTRLCFISCGPCFHFFSL